MRRKCNRCTDKRLDGYRAERLLSYQEVKSSLTVSFYISLKFVTDCYVQCHYGSSVWWTGVALSRCCLEIHSCRHWMYSQYVPNTPGNSALDYGISFMNLLEATSISFHQSVKVGGERRERGLGWWHGLLHGSVWRMMKTLVHDVIELVVNINSVIPAFASWWPLGDLPPHLGIHCSAGLTSVGDRLQLNAHLNGIFSHNEVDPSELFSYLVNSIYISAVL